MGVRVKEMDGNLVTISPSPKPLKVELEIKKPTWMNKLLMQKSKTFRFKTLGANRIALINLIEVLKVNDFDDVIIMIISLLFNKKPNTIKNNHLHFFKNNTTVTERRIIIERLLDSCQDVEISSLYLEKIQTFNTH